MQWRNTADTYGAVAKFLHWTIVVLIIAQFIIAESADDLPNGIEKLQRLSLHKSVGMTVLALALVRIGWKLVNRGAPTPVAMPRWQRISAAASHGLLYLLILAQPLSGWAMSSAANVPVTYFGRFQFPMLVAPNHDLHEGLEELHEGLFITLAVVALIHAAAALYHHFRMRDDVLRRMLPWGAKRAA
jgi:cytochrome b561